MGARPARAWASVLLTACLAGVAVPQMAPAEPRRMPKDFFAVGAGWLNHLALQDDLRGLAVQARQMDRLGIGSARLAADWDTAEPAAPRNGTHSYWFAPLDRAVEALARSGVRPTLFLIGVPHWARGPSGTTCGSRTAPPEDSFAAFARAVTARFGRGGMFWSEHPGLPSVPVRQYEVWNEENWVAYACPMVDPARYAKLFLATSGAIHGVDPRAKVIVGGLVGLRKDTYDSGLFLHGMQSIKFLSQMLAAEPAVRSQINGIGFHSYAVWPAQNLRLVAWFRDGLRDLGLGRTPIVYNEFGWPTKGPDARTRSEKVRVRFMTRTAWALARSGCRITQIAPHTWATAEQDPGNAEEWFGIVDPQTARPHGAGRAYSAVARRFEGLLRKPPPRRGRAVCKR
jgi:hypothetical protein